MKKFFILAILTLPFAFAACTREENNSNGNKKPSYTAVAGEAVDLGLSVKWSSTNLGAISSTDFGDFFAWGETAPKDIYTFETYKLCKGSKSTLTRYNNNSNYGTVDNKTEFKDYDYEDDAARQALGGKWRIPTESEWIELWDGCNWSIKEKYNGTKINGCLLTSKINGASIFLPAAGRRKDTEYALMYDDGFYWSSSLDTDEPSNAKYFGFTTVEPSQEKRQRSYGYSVRPVCEY